ncbi:hypothetical protein Tco_1520142 [Tanacetum coccineum]
MGKPPSSYGLKLYSVTPFPKSKGLPKIDESHAFSKPVTSFSVPIPQESKVVKNDKMIAPGMFRIDPRVNITAKTRRPQPRSNTKNDRVPSASKSSCIMHKEVEKFLGTVRFRNDHVAAIMGFDDLQWGNILITRVYFVEGLGHNLFSVGQFCDSNLEVAFRRNTCFVRNLKGVDLLKGNRTTNLYTFNLHEMASTSSICLMARATSTKS